MLVEDNSCSLCSDREPFKRKRRIPLYFSSVKALKRSKMTRGKKAMSRTAASTGRNLKKTLNFGEGSRGMEADVPRQHFKHSQATQDHRSEDSTLSAPEEQSNVSFLSNPS